MTSNAHIVQTTSSPLPFDPLLVPIDNPWQYEFCMSKAIDGHELERAELKLCARGYIFPSVVPLTLILGFIATFCLVRLQVHRPNSHHHRKVLFFMLVSIALLRGFFASYVTARIRHVHTIGDGIPLMEFLSNWLIPVNCLTDYLTSCVDFLMTFFWLSILQAADGNRMSQKLRRAPIVMSFVFLCGGLVCFFVDLHDDKKSPRTWNVYKFTMGYMAVLMFTSAFLHSASVAVLLFRLKRLRDSNLTEKLRSHFFAVSIIGFICTLCWAFRGVVLLGRVAGNSAFVDGRASFNNPNFTFVYFTVVMNLPCIVVAIAFYRLSIELFTTNVDDVVIGKGYTETRPANVSFAPGHSRRAPRSPSPGVSAVTFAKQGEGESLLPHTESNPRLSLLQQNSLQYTANNASFGSSMQSSPYQSTQGQE